MDTFFQQMGGNFYLIGVNISKDAIVGAIQNNDFEQAKELIDQYTRRIHIGKRYSGNFCFSFDHNHWEHYNSRQELDDWLLSGEIIYDDGTPVSFDQFWEIVNSCGKETDALDREHFRLQFREHSPFF